MPGEGSPGGNPTGTEPEKSHSAGSCDGGPLPVGTWWPERALMYARFQTTWLARPAGTIQGFYRR